MRISRIVLLGCVVVLGMPGFSHAVDIYRSVGPGNTAALDTGTADGNSMTIGSGTATFDNAVPDNVGVGDVVQYDITGDTLPDALVFIHGRISETGYSVRDVLGAVPGDAGATQDWAIFRAYTSFYNAERGVENTGIDGGLVNFDPGNRDLVSNDENYYFACYNDAVDTTPTTWMGWISDASHIVTIYTP